MNPVQMASQIKARLIAATWPEGGRVFLAGAVAVVADEPSEEHIPKAWPWALIALEDGNHDEETPDLLTQRFGVTVGCQVAGDALGEAALIGGPVSAVGSNSANRGVGEVASRARETIQALTGADGCRVILSGSTIATPRLLGRPSHIAIQTCGVEAVCTSSPHYAAPQALHWEHGSGRWRWEGQHCSARYDFMRYKLMRKAGTTPSQSVSDGTLLYTGTDPFVTGVPASGYVFTVFAEYSARQNGLVHGTSSPEVGAYRIP